MKIALSSGGESSKTGLRRLKPWSAAGVSSFDETKLGRSYFSVQLSAFGVRRSPRAAFTLVELVIVIVIIGIISAMIIPEMKGGYQDAQLRSTCRSLVDVFGIASSRAVSLNQLHRVRLDAKTGRYVIEKRTRETLDGDQFAPLKDVSDAEGTLDTRVSIQIRKPEEIPAAAADTTSATASEAASPIDTISFYSDGTADSAELLLRDKQGFRLALRINPITSRVKILDLGHE
jgi:prepilin-type N-terminal cleavage/methylation domain-containing protein